VKLQSLSLAQKLIESRCMRMQMKHSGTEFAEDFVPFSRGSRLSF
jgi:hypothetical protein